MEKIKKYEDPLFIVGVPRSGTTWIWGLLTSHADVRSLERHDFDPSKPSVINNKRQTSETGAFINFSDDFIKQTIRQKQLFFIMIN